MAILQASRLAHKWEQDIIEPVFPVQRVFSLFSFLPSSFFDLKVKPKQLCLYLCRDDQEEQKHPRHNLSKKEVTTRVDAPL